MLQAVDKKFKKGIHEVDLIFCDSDSNAES